MGACTGKCCAVFNFSSPPEVLAKRAETHKDSDPEYAAEQAFLADMFITLTPDEAVERAERFAVEPPEGFDLRSWAEAAPSYTCRHWDEDSMLCTVYEDRPTMCREYPYAGKCQHDCACTFRAEQNVRTKWAAISVRQAVRAS